MTDKKMPEPMDAGAPERDSAEPVANNRRACYAAKQLVKEVLDLFPETSYDYTSFNLRNTAITVCFDTEEGSELEQLIRLVDADARVDAIVRDNHDRLAVDFYNRPRTYDIKDTFGLEDAWLVLTGDEYEGGDAFDTSDDEQDGGSA
jgi:hypothetical protein